VAGIGRWLKNFGCVDSACRDVVRGPRPVELFPKSTRLDQGAVETRLRSIMDFAPNSSLDVRASPPRFDSRPATLRT
jgi:hypothetical protein